VHGSLPQSSDEKAFARGTFVGRRRSVGVWTVVGRMADVQLMVLHASIAVWSWRLAPYDWSLRHVQNDTVSYEPAKTYTDYVSGCQHRRNFRGRGRPDPCVLEWGTDSPLYKYTSSLPSPPTLFRRKLRRWLPNFLPHAPLSLYVRLSSPFHECLTQKMHSKYIRDMMMR